VYGAGTEVAPLVAFSLVFPWFLMVFIYLPACRASVFASFFRASLERFDTLPSSGPSTPRRLPR
jgi:hypothetical protein